MRIEHIDEVLPHVEGRDDFVVAHKPGYTVIDYVYTQPDSFDDPVRVECRGIKFGPDGRTLARPFGKFFNIGQTAASQAGLVDLSRPHVIMDKIDGSMIHPAIVNDEVVFMTRMGRTDVAKWAEELLTDQMRAALRHHLTRWGTTPIFEFTSLKNRVIIRHEKPELHLLAVRETVSGDYLRHTKEDFEVTAEDIGVSAVPFHSSEWQTMQEFVDFARVIQGKEGFVIKFEGSEFYKIKGDDYVLKHKSKDATSLEKNVLAMILTGALDDVLPLLDEETRSRIEYYAAEVNDGVAETAMMIGGFVAALAHVDQKTFAVKHASGFTQPVHKALAFQVRAGKAPLAAVQQAILKNTGSQPDVDSVRHLFGAWWEA